ncbi:MAG: hypothetical protein E7019_03065 [Alphaproteobacteria bacterium]|nr:hypothetical protein [Alphaproteobacteria bacterium]
MKNARKFLLGGIFSLLLCNMAQAQEASGVECVVQPTCEELGYSNTRDCSGRSTIHCPFDSSYYYCSDTCEELGYVDNTSSCSTTYGYDLCPFNNSLAICKQPPVKECTLGSVLYGDLKCYMATPVNKTAIAVVINTTNRVAVSLTQSAGIPWQNGGTADIEGIPNETDYLTVVATNSTSTSPIGQNYTKAAAAVSTPISPAALTCYNSTAGGVAKGTWFLPTPGDLQHALWDTIAEGLNTPIQGAGGSPFAVNALYWSISEYDASKAWAAKASSDGTPNGTATAKTTLAVARCFIHY